jgi:hypothetical protein
MAKETEVRFDEQAFLIDFYKEFVHLNTTTYKNFLQVEGDPSYVMSKIFAKDFQVKSSKRSKDVKLSPFFYLSTLQLSALIPKIRIYKITYKNKNENKGFAEYTGIEEQEFYFNDYTTPDSILKSNRQRGTDIGIQSFSWEDAGTNEVESGVFFNANLRIYLQNAESFGLVRGGGLKISDLLLPSGRTSKEKKAAAKKNARTANPIYDDREFQIKAIVGWAVPDGSNKLFSKAERDAIKKLQISFFLTSPRHEIEFNEDGSVTLSLDYIASIDARMRSKHFDLFNIEDGGRGDKIISALKKVKKGDLSRAEEQKKRIQKLKSALTDLKGVPLDGVPGKLPDDPYVLDKFKSFVDRGVLGSPNLDPEDVIERHIKSMEELLGADAINTGNLEDSIENAAFDQRNKAYSRIIDQLQKKRKVYQFFISQEEVTLWEESIELFEDEKNAQEKNLLVLKNREAKKNEILTSLGSGRDVSIAPIWEESMNNFQRQMTEAANADARAALVKTYLQDSKEKPGEGQKDIQFFFFGDLVEVAIEIIVNPPLDSAILEGKSEMVKFSLEAKRRMRADLLREQFTFILGPLEMVEVKVNGKNTVRNHFSVALADIPISARQFDRWFVEYIVKPMKESYNLKNFLIDMLTALLNNALSPLGYGPIGQFNKTKMGVSIFSAAFKKKKDRALKISKGRIGMEEFISSMPSNATSYRGIKKLMQFFFMYHVGIANHDLNAKQVKDIKKGIIHYNVGADRGIVKTVKFDVDKIPGRAEAQIEKAQKLEDRNFLYANKYNVVLELVGNPLYKPGMVFYLNPRSLGFSIEESDDVGLGGYYSVVKVSSAIDDGKFTTTVRGVFLAPSISPFPEIKTTVFTGKEGSKFQLNDLPGVQTFGGEKEEDEKSLIDEAIKVGKAILNPTQIRKDYVPGTFKANPNSPTHRKNIEEEN